MQFAVGCLIPEPARSPYLAAGSFNAPQFSFGGRPHKKRRQDPLAPFSVLFRTSNSALDLRVFRLQTRHRRYGFQARFFHEVLDRCEDPVGVEPVFLPEDRLGTMLYEPVGEAYP